MKIGIEGCTWSNRRGYGRFLRGLVTAMASEYPQHEITLVLDEATARDWTFPAGTKIHAVPTRFQPSQAASADGSRSPMDLLRMSWAASRLPVDVFWFPTRYLFVPLVTRTPVVVTFHDATPEQSPELIFPTRRSHLFWRAKTWLALRQADRLVTVSADARAQLAGFLGYRESDIGLITEGPDPIFRPLDDEASRVAARRRYDLPLDVPLVLYVGGISPHKNLQGLLHAMKLVAQATPAPWHLVLVGDYKGDSFWGCYQELVELGRTLDLTDRVTFTGFVPDDDLVTLYNTATMLVLPSFGEGFGLPVLEAMTCGLPVAVSNRNSLPEVVGSAGILFDPSSHADIAAAVGRLLSDTPLRQDLRVQGLKRAEHFSWTAAARTMMGILEEVAQRR
jgi:glycosyltransferase involved in cell wall biosynthesis